MMMMMVNVLSVHTVDCAIEKLGESNAAVISSAVTFGCKTNSSLNIRWDHRKPRSKDVIHMYNGFEFRDGYDNRYVVTTNNVSGQSMLLIKSVAFSDAGTYTCREPRTAKYRETFELVVLGKPVGNKVLLILTS